MTEVASRLIDDTPTMSDSTREYLQRRAQIDQVGGHEVLELQVNDQKRALCLATNPVLFSVPEMGYHRRETDNHRVERERVAKWLCKRCDINAGCLVQGLSAALPNANTIMGGMNYDERQDFMKSDQPTQRLREVGIDVATYAILADAAGLIPSDA